jgi:hypothetical protein
VHNSLAPGQNKRLVCAELWEKILYKYFLNEENPDEFEEIAEIYDSIRQLH